ncbi:MAG: type II toxin-antitoxin system RelE family toxin [Streptosporangiaceae bacterium]
MTGEAARWRLDVRPRAQRQLAHLPEKIATAAAEFITGALLDNPRRVGHPLQGEYTGQHSARRGADWRVRYRIEQDTHAVIVLDVFTAPTLMAREVTSMLTRSSSRGRSRSLPSCPDRRGAPPLITLRDIVTTLVDGRACG